MHEEPSTRGTEYVRHQVHDAQEQVRHEARETKEQVEYGAREALEHVNRVRGTLDMRARSKRNLADSGQCGLFSNYLI